MSRHDKFEMATDGVIYLDMYLGKSCLWTVNVSLSLDDLRLWTYNKSGERVLMDISERDKARIRANKRAYKRYTSSATGRVYAVKSPADVSDGIIRDYLRAYEDGLTEHVVFGELD